ncbi:hypothetical protein ACFQ2B_13200 [Streptomyces stramineus]
MAKSREHERMLRKLGGSRLVQYRGLDATTQNLTDFLVRLPGPRQK